MAMNEEDFASLKRGIVEVGLMMRGELEPAREFTYRADGRKPLSAWAVCVSHEDDTLTPRKLYPVQLAEHTERIGVIDDDGEALFCPREWFVLVTLPRELEETLAEVA